MFTWIWGSILVPTWLHFGSQNPPKSSQKSIPRCIKFLIDFGIDFLSILEANLEPCWPLFRTKYGEGILAKGGFCWVYVIFRFFGRPGPLLAPFWGGLDFFDFLIDFGVGFGRFWGPVWKSDLTPPSFLLGLCYFSIFWSSWPPLGPIWARFWEGLGLHFGGFWSQLGAMLGPFGARSGT